MIDGRKLGRIAGKEVRAEDRQHRPNRACYDPLKFREWLLLLQARIRIVWIGIDALKLVRIWELVHVGRNILPDAIPAHGGRLLASGTIRALSRGVWIGVCARALGEEAFAALEQSVVCEVEVPPMNWALAAIDPAHNSAATKKSILRSILR